MTANVLQGIVVAVLFLLTAYIIVKVLIIDGLRETRWREDAPRRMNDPTASELVRQQARAIVEWDARQGQAVARGEELRRQERQYRRQRK